MVYTTPTREFRPWAIKYNTPSSPSPAPPAPGPWTRPTYIPPLRLPSKPLARLLARSSRSLKSDSKRYCTLHSQIQGMRAQAGAGGNAATGTWYVPPTQAFVHPDPHHPRSRKGNIIGKCFTRPLGQLRAKVMLLADGRCERAGAAVALTVEMGEMLSFPI